MALPAWPASLLPNPSREGYQLSRGDATIRTDMEAGPARVRRTYTNVPTVLAIQWDFTGDELKIFRHFWRVKTHSGSKHFLIDLYLDNEIASDVECRFMGPYTSARVSSADHWQVKVQLEIIDATSDASTQLPETSY